MANVTDLVAGTGVGGVQEAAGANYGLTTYTRSLPNGTTEYVATYFKRVAGLAGQDKVTISGTGTSTVDAPTALANALNALNAVRRHRYLGAPGKQSGSAQASSFADGAATVATIDAT